MRSFGTILLYRRTHRGDPNRDSLTFGIHDCMGQVRDWNYDSVIGIGGSSPWGEDSCIRHRVTWVGIGPIRVKRTEDTEKYSCHSLVRFKSIHILDCDGPLLEEVSPRLYEYMFIEKHVPRAAKTFPDEIYNELCKIIEFVTTKNISNRQGEQLPNPSRCSKSFIVSEGYKSGLINDPCEL